MKFYAEPFMERVSDRKGKQSDAKISSKTVCWEEDGDPPGDSEEILSFRFLHEASKEFKYSADEYVKWDKRFCDLACEREQRWN